MFTDLSLNIHLYVIVDIFFIKGFSTKAISVAITHSILQVTNILIRQSFEYEKFKLSPMRQISLLELTCDPLLASIRN